METLARVLCNDFDARLIADQVEAPLYDDSDQITQSYWLTLAACVARARPTTTGESGL